MNRLDQLFQQFLRERTYLHNVSPATREWYGCAWKAFTVAQTNAPERPELSPPISRLQKRIIRTHDEAAPCAIALVPTILDTGAGSPSPSQVSWCCASARWPGHVSEALREWRCAAPGDRAEPPRVRFGLQRA
jgi:hypothetical protein